MKRYFSCDCEKHLIELSVGEVSKPCPYCHRVYKATYDSEKSTIRVVEVKPIKSILPDKSWIGPIIIFSLYFLYLAYLIKNI